MGQVSPAFPGERFSTPDNDEENVSKPGSGMGPLHEDDHLDSSRSNVWAHYSQMRNENPSGRYVRRLSMNFSERFSQSRTLTLSQLQEGAIQYYKQNSYTFGQVVAVDDHNGSSDEEEIVGQVHAKRGAKDNPFRLQLKTVLDKTKGELEAKESPKPSQVITKSRLELIVLEQSWFTVYKRLFFLSFVLNIIGLALAATGNFPYAKSRAALFSVANIFVVVLVRNEVFLRLVFWLAVNLLGYSWIPLQIKTITTAFLQSLGGIHSGCGMGAMVWLVFAIVELFKHRRETSKYIFALSWATFFLLSCTSLAAFPAIRHIHHNAFERVHRFAGWSSLVSVWAFVVLSIFWVSDSESYNISLTLLLEMQSFWYTAATTCMIVLPWLFVRKVAVETIVLPTKLNTLLHFKGGVKPGILARISPSPFSEWHAFGIISDGKDRHTILAGAVGDFTKSLVEHPPTHIWVRTFHFAGLPYLANMYNRALLVATGSGICVFMSFLTQPSRAKLHVIWIAKSIHASYGDEIWDTVQDSPSDRLTLIDTAVSGRPKMKELVVTKAKEWHADVVIVTSNPAGTYEIVKGCKAVGIPAYGPIWDS